MPGDRAEYGTWNSEPRGNAWTGELVRLRTITEADWDRFHSFDADTEGARNGYFIHFPQSPEAARAWAAGEAAIRQSPDHDHYRFAIEALEPGVGLVGSMNVHEADRVHRRFAYGISLGAEYRRRGYASDALRILLRHYFDELGYHRVRAMVYAFNEPSIALHQRFGFVQEGRLREHHFTGGKFHDVLVFGMTAAEFRAKYFI